MADNRPDNGTDKRTGYDMVIQRNKEVFLETLVGVDYTGFLRGCPRNPGHVTQMDLLWTMKIRAVAMGFGNRENEGPPDIPIPADPYDPIEFSKFTGQIIEEIEKEIKHSDPRNLEAEAAKESIEDLNQSIKAIVADIVPQKVDQILPREVANQEDVIKKEYEEALNVLNTKDEEKTKKIEELETRIREIQESMKQTPAPAPSEPAKPAPEAPLDRLSLAMKVDRFWAVRTRDIDDSIDVREVRGKEGGGELNLTVSAGAGNLYWIIDSTPEGQSILYERLKKSIVEFMETGSVHSDLMYSMPREGETRIFAPRITNGQIYVKDGWIQEKGVFSREYSSLLIVSIGESRFTIDFRLKLSQIERFKELVKELVNRILLSGDEVANDRPYA